MPATRQRPASFTWSGGLNEDAHPLGVDASQLRTARNVYWRGNALASRGGSSRLPVSALNSGLPGLGLYDYVRQTNERHVVAVFESKVYDLADTAAPVDITGAIVMGTDGSGNHQVQFTTFNDVLIFVNNVNVPLKWDAGASTTIGILGGSPPERPTSIISKWNRVFLAGIESAQRTIRYSALNDAETWDAANTVQAGLGASGNAIEGTDRIWSLGHLGDSIFVGLANSCGRVFYTGETAGLFRYTPISQFGVVGPNVYVPYGDGGYFLSDRGVHYVNPSNVFLAYESSLVSGRKIRSLWNSLNRARFRYAVGTLYYTAQGNWIIAWSMSSAGSTKNDLWLIMDVTDGPGKERFAIWTGLQANAIATVKDGTTLQEKLLFATNDGFVWQADSGTSDNGTAFATEASTRWEDFGLPTQRKRLREMYLELTQGTAFNFTVEALFDYQIAAGFILSQTSTGSTSQAQWGTLVWGAFYWPGPNVIQSYLLGVGDGRAISFRFSTSGADQPWVLYKFVPTVAVAHSTKQVAEA